MLTTETLKWEEKWGWDCGEFVRGEGGDGGRRAFAGETAAGLAGGIGAQVGKVEAETLKI